MQDAADSGSNAALAQALMRRGGPASLATLTPDGAPFASYVVTAPGADGAPLMLLSRLAVHTQNLAADSRAALLLVAEPSGSEALTASRLTLTGRALPDPDPAALTLFLTARPEAARYAGFADFALYRLQVESGHLVAGFGRIARLSVAELLRNAAA
jgi:putative heme iron utilization protein